MLYDSPKNMADARKPVVDMISGAMSGERPQSLFTAVINAAETAVIISNDKFSTDRIRAQAEDYF